MKASTSSSYWFYTWPLWVRILLCLLLYPIFIPILAWPKIAHYSPKIKVISLVCWIVFVGMMQVVYTSGLDRNENIITQEVSRIESSETANETKVNKDEEKRSEENKKSETSVQNSNTHSISQSIDNNTFLTIPGITPVDVYKIFEKQGFKTEKKSGTGEAGSYLWYDSRKQAAGIDYRVSTYTLDGKAETVKSISATAVLNGIEEKDIIAVLPYLQDAATVPYEKYQPDIASKWVAENFNNDKASIEIAGVTYTILAPTKMARTLRISVN